MKLLIGMAALFVSAAVCAGPSPAAPLEEAIEEGAPSYSMQRWMDDLYRRTEVHYARRLLELEHRVLADIVVLDALATVDHPGLRMRNVLAHGELDADDYGMGSRLNEYVYEPGPWFHKAVGGPAILEQMRLAPARRAAVRLGIARERAGILARAQYEAVCIEQLRDYVLNVQLPRIESALSGGGDDQVPVQPGMVRGIIHAPNAAVALVGDAIVRQGGRLGEVAIASIHPDRVEFRKADSVWTQGIGEPPSRW